MSDNPKNQAGESLFQSYISSVIALLQRVASEEEPAVQQAAELMADPRSPVGVTSLLSAARIPLSLSRTWCTARVG